MIHVFGPPECEAMEPEESFCSEGVETIVTYHVRPVGTCRGWMCASCGFEGWDRDDVQAS